MGHDAPHGSGHYVKIYGILMVLFIISVLGPEIGILIVTLITAFGIAVVKATMVMAYFMHLNVEKKYIWGLLASAVIFIGGLFIGVAPDVMLSHGTQWLKCNSFDEKNLARFEHHNVPASKIGLNRSGRVCTPQRF
jgi:caa(3)-type oxidase subunit IV